VKRLATIQSSVGPEQSFDRPDGQLASTGRKRPKAVGQHWRWLIIPTGINTTFWFERVQKKWVVLGERNILAWTET
jgi:hypothetical protein